LELHPELVREFIGRNTDIYALYRKKKPFARLSRSCCALQSLPAQSNAASSRDQMICENALRAR